jgi:hypothetical protein
VRTAAIRLALDLQRRDRLLDHLDPVPLGHLPLLRVELQAPPQRQQRDVVRVGAGHEGGLAQPVRAVADHRDPAVARLVAVADRAVAHQAAPHGVREVRQLGLDVHRAGGEQHPPRPDLPRAAAPFSSMAASKLPPGSLRSPATLPATTCTP